MAGPPVRVETLEILRCPFCGGQLALVDSVFHQRKADEIVHGVLACSCCAFPVVDGIAVMHAQDSAAAARAHLDGGRPQLARRALLALDASTADRFDEAASGSSTYAALVDALGPSYEGRYFLYRFSDPSFLVVDAIVRAVGGAALRGTGRAIDLCGGSGHLTRSLQRLTTAAPVLADLYFAKLWLGRRFVAPDCEAVCCDGNLPLPFARGAFSFALCADSFMFIWTKRLCVAEMLRLVERPGAPGAVAITHAHNQLVWSPSHGQPLTPAGYRALFESVRARLFSEARLFEEVLKGVRLDLSRQDADAKLDADAAVAMIASADDHVFQHYPLTSPARSARGVFHVNPLYTVRPDGDRLHLRLTFPNRAYEDEFGGCRAYLPDAHVLDRAALDRLRAGGPLDELGDELRRCIILDLPRDYV
jgi:uncharacterized protein YbaR (Trm112 family)